MSGVKILFYLFATTALIPLAVASALLTIMIICAGVEFIRDEIIRRD